MELKPAEKWLQTELDWDPKAPEPVCDDCRTEGVTRVRTFNMPIQHQLALKAYMESSNPTQALKNASKASGLSQGWIKELISGRRDQSFRQAFQLCLESIGLDLVGVAKIMGECAVATEVKWNPKEQQFDHFADYRTRLNTAKQAARLLELEVPHRRGPAQVNQILISHNLGKGDEIDPPNVFKVKPANEVVDVE